MPRVVSVLTHPSNRYSPRTPLCTSHRLLYTPAPTTTTNTSGTAREMMNRRTGGTCSVLKGRWMVMSERENSRLWPPIWFRSSRRNLRRASESPYTSAKEPYEPYEKRNIPKPHNQRPIPCIPTQHPPDRPSMVVCPALGGMVVRHTGEPRAECLWD